MEARSIQVEEIKQVCRDIFSDTPTLIEHPGGTSRKTCLVTLGGERFAVARRRTEHRAALEMAALQNLSKAGLAPFPVARKGCYVVQKAIAGKRLSEAFDNSFPAAQEKLMRQALISLRDMQKTAEDSGFGDTAPKIGLRPGWVRDLALTPLRVAERLDLPDPSIQFPRLEALLTPEDWSFVKWDARPGNAIVTDQGICWFDWEHCGQRTATDDAAWLIADEWSPDLPEFDEDVCAVFMQSGKPMSSDRLWAMAFVHSFIRIELVLSRKGSGGWWDRGTCLAYDRVGVTPAHLMHLARRARRWAAYVPELKPAAELCENIMEKAEEQLRLVDRQHLEHASAMRENTT